MTRAALIARVDAWLSDPDKTLDRAADLLIECADALAPSAPAPSEGIGVRGRVLAAIHAAPGIDVLNLAAEVGVTTVAVYGVVRPLVFRGLVRREPGRAGPGGYPARFWPAEEAT